MQENEDMIIRAKRGLIWGQSFNFLHLCNARGEGMDYKVGKK